MKHYLLIGLLICCGYGKAIAAINVQVDPQAVQLGEPFHLILTTEDAQSKGMPDLTVLQRDFIIMGTDRRMNYIVVNGRAQSSSQWSILLRAKRAGVIPIPAIKVGQQQSSATSVEIITGSGSATDNTQSISADNGVMLKTAVSHNQPFVNQQVIYTVKLYNNQQLLDAEYQPPRIEDALLIPLGEERRYQTNENGSPYAVVEQQYVVFPQKSGDLQLVAPTFNAMVYDVVPRRISIKGETIKLAVKPMPASYTGKYWLPAKQVTLSEQYSKRGTTFLQGTTLIRTVTLQAQAVPAQLLPTLSFESGKEFNVYPENPAINNAIKQQQLVGESTIKLTYLLNKPGQITIPAVQVPWFNTTTGKEELATLPAQVLMVDAKADYASQAVTPTSQKSIVVAAKSVAGSSNRLAWWLAIGFAAAWFVTMGLWWYRPKLSFANKDTRAALKQVQEACTQHNPAHAQEALLHWAALQWPDAKLLNLYDVARFVHDPQFKKQLLLLTQMLYSKEKSVRWHGDELWRKVAGYRHKKPASTIKSQDLPPINPV